MEGLVLLKPKQAYGGCLGAIVDEIPRGHHRVRMYQVYIDGLGTVVRGEDDLTPVGDADVVDPTFRYVTPRYWRAMSTAAGARKALMQAIRNNNHQQAVMYADEAATAQLIMEAEDEAYREDAA